LWLYTINHKKTFPISLKSWSSIRAKKSIV
jgi:hypothetical protein